MLVFDRLGFPPYPGISQLSPLYSLPFHLIPMHKLLECLDVSLASMLDTHPLAFLSLFFYTRLLRSDAGVQEQEILEAYYYVETPDDQE